MLTFFKTLISKKAATLRLTKRLGNNKFVKQIISSSYHIEPRTFIEASCIN